MKRIAGAFLLILFAVSAYPTMADNINIQGEKSIVDNSSSNPLPDEKQMEKGIRGAIFRNRQQLLTLLIDPKMRSAFCSPMLNDSYELFQDSLLEELEVLWDIDIYASEYGLTKMEHDAVLSCSKKMEKYLDNFKLWKELERDTASH